MYRKMAVVFAAVGIAAIFLFLVDNSQMLSQNKTRVNSLKRNKPGGGSRKEELNVQVGQMDEKITVEITEEQFTKKELQQEFERAGMELEALILGENQSLDEVRSNLNLISRMPGTGISVAWELDNYKVMNQQGELQPETLKESGTLLKLDAFLSYGNEKAQHTMYAKLFPPRRSKTEQCLQNLHTELERINEETKEQDRMPLPNTLDGTAVVWSNVVNFRALGLLLLGVALSLYVYVSEEQKKKVESQERIRQMELAYPQLINRFTLYMGAGMTVRKVWFKLAEDYEKHKRKKETQAVYEEMVYTMHEMQSGTSENECYESFGERCNLAVYRKFGTLLSQNLKKGTKGLAEILKQEALNSFEERKSLARKLGEEAGTKMLFPMFLMFGVVLVMIVVPAFFSMRV